MESIYAQGIDCIVLLQKTFPSTSVFLLIVNNLSDPNVALTILFPIISVIDPLSSSEFFIVAAMCNWINCILKWVLIEDRPYWWIRETHYYGPAQADKPKLRLTHQTCETAPGCPSGHTMLAAAIVYLFCSWIDEKQLSDKKYMQKIWKYNSWIIASVFVIFVSMGRLFIATHFPHQCLVGIFCGLLIGHAIPAYWITPFMNSIDDNQRLTSDEKKKLTKRFIFKHVMFVGFMIITSFAFYWGQKLVGIDPSWSVKLAFKWCPSHEFMHFITTPFYSLVQNSGAVLGWALSVTPSLKTDNTKNRSVIIAAFSAFVFQQMFRQWQETISRDSAVYYYLINFFGFAIQPFFFLRVVPVISRIGQKINRTRRTRVMKEN